MILQDKNLAYAYYTFSGEAIPQPRTPVIEMDYLNGEWKINGFAHYLVDECAEDCFRKLKYELYYECHKKLGSDAPERICEGYALINLKYKCDKSTVYKCVLIK